MGESRIDLPQMACLALDQPASERAFFRIAVVITNEFGRTHSLGLCEFFGGFILKAVVASAL